jgi:membrane protein YdbS with pleckstrin-like domain
MRRITIKEGPLVFIRNVLVMELAAAVFLYIASFLENYEMLFKTIGLAKYIRYDIFIMLVFSLFQLIYILLLFLDWYFTHYEIHESEIIRKSGLLFRHRKSVTLGDVTSVEIYQSPLSRMMHHATIILEHSDGRQTKLKNIGNYEEYVHIIKQFVHSSSGKPGVSDVKSLIKYGESLHVEFKETLRFDTRKKEVSKEIERMVLKTIVGFLNSNGGTLIVGVNDRGEVTGLATDYTSLPKKNRDGLENHLSMLIKVAIGLPFAKYVSTYFETLEGKDVCVITVNKSHKPAYLRYGNGKDEEFFVRVGNSTQPFSMSEAEEYIKTNW